MRRPALRSLAGGAAGIAAGAIGGMVLTSVSAAVPAARAVSGPAVIDAFHLPPVLTLPGEPLRLRYGLTCTPREDGRPCDGSGTVYVRAGTSGSFRALPLRRGVESRDGRYYVDVPRAVAGSAGAFSYYAVLRDDATGAEVSLPAGGADAPQVSTPLLSPLDVPLGRHAFGDVRPADARVVTAPWGSKPADVGLSGSRELGYTGPSAFDVEPDGTVDVLDSVNERVIRFARGRNELVPLDGELRLADFAAEPDGSFDVLDLHGRLRRFARDGAPVWTQKLADRTWLKLGRGASVLQEPSEQWMPVARDGMPLTRAEQADGAHTEKLLAGGRDALVDRVGAGELRVAELDDGVQLRSWRITSATPLGEVQLVQSDGNKIVVVTHVYTDDRDEFVVLVLGGKGLVASFSLASGSWTETAPLARFRFAGGALYRLQTTEAGAAVDRFDLEVPQ
jgi:hypothetical protein